MLQKRRDSADNTARTIRRHPINRGVNKKRREREPDACGWYVPSQDKKLQVALSCVSGPLCVIGSYSIPTKTNQVLVIQPWCLLDPRNNLKCTYCICTRLVAH